MDTSLYSRSRVGVLFVLFLWTDKQYWKLCSCLPSGTRYARVIADAGLQSEPRSRPHLSVAVDCAGENSSGRQGGILCVTLLAEYFLRSTIASSRPGVDVPLAEICVNTCAQAVVLTVSNIQLCREPNVHCATISGSPIP